MYDPIREGLDVVRFVGGAVPEESVISNDKLTIKRIQYGNDKIDCLLKVYHNTDLSLQYKHISKVTRKNPECGLAKVYAVRYMHGNTYVIEERVQGHTLREEIRLRYKAIQKCRDVERDLPGAFKSTGVSRFGSNEDSFEEEPYSPDHLFLKREVLHIGTRLCMAVGQLHENGIIHGDIRPENLMIQIDGTVKLIDYDNTTFYRGKEEVRAEEHSTMVYWTPEKKDYRLTDRSDIYQIGVVLYELLYGWKSEGCMFERRPNGSVAFADKRADRDLNRVINQCLAMKPEDRYRNIGALQKALSRCGKGFSDQFLIAGTAGAGLAYVLLLLVCVTRSARALEGKAVLTSWPYLAVMGLLALAAGYKLLRMKEMAMGIVTVLVLSGIFAFTYLGCLGI